MHKNEKLTERLQGVCAPWIASCVTTLGQVTLETTPEHVFSLLTALKNDPDLDFDMLIDLCGVDYFEYGVFEWETDSTTQTGFSRGVESLPSQTATHLHPSRFAVVYHLLSLSKNHRLRVRVFCEDLMPMVASVTSLWPCANWFEREAYDLFGILFKGHPDLRRLLTDYGFIGHPFRKDFPLSGQVEMRYDGASGRVIYEPVDIEPRVLVPKVGRRDHRYEKA